MPGYVAAQSFKSQPGTALEIAEAGDFEKDQPFTAAVWVKLTAGRPSPAHLSPAWTTSTTIAAGTLGLENGRVNAHFINTWDSDAI